MRWPRDAWAPEETAPRGGAKWGQLKQNVVTAKEQQPFLFLHRDPALGDHRAFLLMAGVYLKIVCPNCTSDFTAATGERRWVHQPSSRYRSTKAPRKEGHVWFE